MSFLGMRNYDVKCVYEFTIFDAQGCSPSFWAAGLGMGVCGGLLVRCAVVCKGRCMDGCDLFLDTL
jgi:hypothetical protein